MDEANREHWQKRPRDVRMRTTRIFHALMESERRLVVNVGGAGSSKTFSTAQYCIHRLLNGENQRILIQRKHFPSLRDTAYKCVLEILREHMIDKTTGKPFNMYDLCEHNKTHNTLSFGSNVIEFRALDDPQKAKSTDYNLIWWEEANQFTWTDFTLAITRGLRRPSKGDFKNKAILTLNPEDNLCWIKTKLEDTGAAEVIFSTYLDNPTLDDAYIADLERLKETDYDYWLVLAKGVYAVMRNMVYRPYLEHETYDGIDFDETIYGVDFGWTCMAVNQIDIKTNPETDFPEVYLTELIYQGTHVKDNPKGLTNTDLIKALDRLIPPEKKRNCRLYCDGAEPARIAELVAAGYMAMAADKDRKTGIDFCKRIKTHTLTSNMNINRERALYKYPTDENGEVKSDDPVKKNDHTPDATRYGVYTHLSPLVNFRPGMTVLEDEKKEKEPLFGDATDFITEEERSELWNREELWASLAV